MPTLTHPFPASTEKVAQKDALQPAFGICTLEQVSETSGKHATAFLPASDFPSPCRKNTYYLGEEFYDAQFER